MNRPFNWLLLSIAAVIILAGGAYYFCLLPSQFSLPLTPPIPVSQSTDEGNMKPDEPPTNQEPYIIPILGRSSRLTASQTRNMEKWRTDVQKMAQARPQEIVLNGPENKRAVAITFDDGPDNVITPQIISILSQQGVKATFFVSGRQVERFPEQINQIAAGGHLVLSHTYSHRQLVLLKTEEIDKEVDLTDRLIKKEIGISTAAVRPPYGSINKTVVDELSRKGKLVILWSIDTLDWTGEDPKVLVDTILNNARSGDIILMHSVSGRTNTVASLPIIIKGLQQKGYSIVRVDQLLGRSL